MALADLSGLQSGKLTLGAFRTFLNTVVPASGSQAYPKMLIEVRDLRTARLQSNCGEANSIMKELTTSRWRCSHVALRPAS